MKELVGKVVNSNNLGCNLTTSKTGAAASWVVLVHSIGKYSASFGALGAFQGVIMAFMGEMIGESLPVIVQAPTNATIDHSLSLAFALEQMAVPTEAKIVTYFSSIGAGNLMNPIAIMSPNTMHLTQLCPVPHAHWRHIFWSRGPL
jgi:hypothetical protein